MAERGAGESRIGAVVLAGGRSSRMGGAHKLLLPLGKRPVVAYALDAALGSGAGPVVVVLGHRAEDVRAALPEGSYQVVVNLEYAAGMSTSLRAGIAALPTDIVGAVILLADQPLVTGDIVARVIAEARAGGRGIVTASFGGRRGTPVYFARGLFPELLAVTGDEGGRSVIVRHPKDVAVVEFTDDAAALDVDDPEQYARLRALWDGYAKGSAG
jgi:molybdenum cofactor cytidylyltransferase